MSSSVYSSAYLFRFLNLIESVSPVQSKRARVWQSSITTLLHTCPPVDDVRALDTASLVQAYVNRQLLQFNTIMPWQLHKMRTAFDEAVEEFEQFTACPRAYLDQFEEAEPEVISAVSSQASHRAPAGARSKSSSLLATAAKTVPYETNYADILASLPRPRFKAASALHAANDEIH